MLLTSIAEVADQPLALDPADLTTESQTNTWWLDAAEPQEMAELTVGQIVAAFERTAEALRSRVGDMGFGGTATFYVWHDEQAGQLRCSTSSRAPDSLPFRGAYTPTDVLAPIVEHFLNDQQPGLIPWADLDHDTGGSHLPTGPAVPRPFPVWTQNIGQRT
jgi:hypothetical protein